MLHFWQWAFSDLKQNNIRGIYSEWLVAQILGLELKSGRESWDAFDLMLPSGSTIEIKSAAYLQSWHDASSNPSKIVFSGLKGKTLLPNTGCYSQQATYNADFYIFCLQTTTDPGIWNALDLEQWRFFVLERLVLETLDLKTLSLKRVTELTQPLNAESLRKKFMDGDYLQSTADAESPLPCQPVA